MAGLQLVGQDNSVAHVITLTWLLLWAERIIPLQNNFCCGTNSRDLSCLVYRCQDPNPPTITIAINPSCLLFSQLSCCVTSQNGGILCKSKLMTDRRETIALCKNIAHWSWTDTKKVSKYLYFVRLFLSFAWSGCGKLDWGASTRSCNIHSPRRCRYQRERNITSQRSRSVSQLIKDLSWFEPSLKNPDFIVTIGQYSLYVWYAIFSLDGQRLNFSYPESLAFADDVRLIRIISYFSIFHPTFKVPDWNLGPYL